MTPAEKMACDGQVALILGFFGPIVLFLLYYLVKVIVKDVWDNWTKNKYE